MKATGPAAVRPGLAVKMHPGHTEAGDQHREAAKEEDCAPDRITPPRNDEPVFVEDDDEQPDGEQRHPGDLRHLEGPGNMRHVVQDDVRQRRILVHVGDPVMDNGHHHRRQPGHKQAVEDSDAQLPSLWQGV